MHTEIHVQARERLEKSWVCRRAVDGAFRARLCEHLFVRGRWLRGLGMLVPWTSATSASASELTSSFVAPANIFWNPIPTPSMTASRMAQLMAPFLAALYPPRIASEPPVKKPAICVVLDRVSARGIGGYMQSRCTCRAVSSMSLADRDGRGIHTHLPSSVLP
jgi:hypothetical protein